VALATTDENTGSADLGGSSDNFADDGSIVVLREKVFIYSLKII
jgi:hypothetical protein